MSSPGAREQAWLEGAEDLYPLSEIQQGMVYHSLRQPGLYHSQMLLPLAEPSFDLGRFQRAVALMLERHAILRSGLFLSGFEEPIQIVYQGAKLPVELEDISHLEHAAQEEHLRCHLAQDLAQPFDPTRPPLWRLRLFRLDALSLCLAWSMHHAITDGWSTACLFAELCQTYERLGVEPDYRPAPLACAYKDFIVDELVAKQDQEGLEFWRQEMAGHRRLELPWKAPTDADGQDAQALIHGHALGPELRQQLTSLAQGHNLSLKGLCLTAYLYMLRMLSRGRQVLTGLVTNCRPLKPDGDKVIGCFLNSVPLRLTLPRRATWLELAHLVEVKLTALKRHERLPLMQIARAVGERGEHGNPFFDVLFNYVSFEAPQGLGPGQPSARIDVEGHTATNTLLDFTVNTSQDRFDLEIIYRTALFSTPDLERLCGYFEAGLRKLARHGQEPLAKTAIMGARETRLLLADFNPTARTFARERAIHDLIARQAAHTPQARAVIFREQTLSYAQLERRAGNLARRLLAQGLRPGEIVALRLQRGLEMAVAVLGVLKAGGAYLPMDPGHPGERLRYLLEDSRAGLLLTTSGLAGQHDLAGLAREISLDALDLDQAHGQSSPLPAVDPGGLAYVIYTSGSTGQPKGVMVEHRALVNRLCWMQRRYPLGPGGLILQKTPYTFDVSVWELLWWGLAGAGVCFLEPGGEKDPARIIETVRANGVTVMHFVPSMLGAFLDYLSADPGRRLPGLASLRQVFASGEALAPQQVRLFNRLLHARHGTRLANLYGPTEAAIDVSWFDCQGQAEPARVPIGRPIDNIRLYVLDQEQEPQPLGVAGELCISGVGLARGYLNRPGLTAKAFAPNPWPPEGPTAQEHGRLYHTGDLARWLPDGNLEYLGRLDHQIKIRGFRVEPGEIERRLNALAPVKDSLVVALGTGAAQRLVAYVLLDPAQAPTLARLLALKAQTPGAQWRELPGQTPLFMLNPGETDFMYQEIVAEDGYLGQGISLPPGAVVLDVGANIGVFSWWVRRQCPDARLLALEPIPQVCELLELNNRLHGLGAKVLNLGLWSKPGRLDFTFYPHASILSGALADQGQETATVAAFLRASGQAAPQGEAQGHLLEELLSQRLEGQDISCPVATLSQVLAQEGLERVDLLKVDVEKGELEVLAGIAEDDWPKIRQLVLEVHDVDGRLEGLRRQLAARGYQVSEGRAGSQAGTSLHTLVARAPDQPLAGQAQTASAPLEPWATPAALASHLGQALAQDLPDYMVPAHFVPLLAWPLGATGKIDRKALPAPQAEAQGQTASGLAPRDELESRLAAIFAQVLGGEGQGAAPLPGVDDNFFELGGDSLRCIAAITRLGQDLGVEIGIPEFLDNLTVAKLAALIRQRQEQGSQPPSPAGPRPPDLADRRQGLDTGGYSSLACRELETELDPARLERALNQVIARNPLLRAVVLDQRRQAILEQAPPYHIEVEDISGLPAPEQEERILAQRRRLAGQVFGPGRWPLFELRALRLGPRRHLLMASLDPLIADGSSLRLVVDDLLAYYHDPGWAPPGPGLVCLRRGAGASLVCFPDLLGLALQFIPLAGALGGHTVHALDYPADGRVDLDELARLVLEAHPEGPPVLLGYSAGGALALAVAQRLEERGLAPRAVVLLDAYCPAPKLRQDQALAARLKARMLADLGSRGGEGRLTPQVLARASRVLDLYLALPAPGPLRAQVHLLAAQGRRESAILGGWQACTRSAYRVHQGRGQHFRMLRLPEVHDNCRLLEGILAGLATGEPARAGGRGGES